MRTCPVPVWPMAASALICPERAWPVGIYPAWAWSVMVYPARISTVPVCPTSVWPPMVFPRAVYPPSNTSRIRISYAVGQGCMTKANAEWQFVVGLYPVRRAEGARQSP